MSKPRQKQLVTIMVLALAAGLALAGRNGWRWPSIRRMLPAASTPQPAPSPQDAIYTMLDAARTGDVKAYVACYTGQMATALEASIRESSAQNFAQYLRNTNAAVKGVAVHEPEKLSDREAKVRVEYVYEDRNEIQTMYLEKAAAEWKIARIDGAERIKTLVPYGTPVK